MKTIKTLIDASFDTMNNQQLQTSEMSIEPAHGIKSNKQKSIRTSNSYGELKVSKNTIPIKKSKQELWALGFASTVFIASHLSSLLILDCISSIMLSIGEITLLDEDSEEELHPCSNMFPLNENA